MIHSKSQNKWRMIGRRSLLLLAVLSLMISLLGFPLYASAIPSNSPAGRMMDDIKRGARDIGRGARDMVDPDHDGILPDGSIDNGIANDGNQFDDNHSNGNMTGNVSDNVTGSIPDTPDTNDGIVDEMRPETMPDSSGSRPSPDTNGDVTDHTGNATDRTNTPSNGSNGSSAPTTSDNHNADQNGNADGQTEGGFRWTGLIVAGIIAVAVIVLICLLIPRKKNK